MISTDDGWSLCIRSVVCWVPTPGSPRVPLRLGFSACVPRLPPRGFRRGAVLFVSSPAEPRRRIPVWVSRHGFSCPVILLGFAPRRRMPRSMEAAPREDGSSSSRRAACDGQWLAGLERRIRRSSSCARVCACACVRACSRACGRGSGSGSVSYGEEERRRRGGRLTGRRRGQGGQALVEALQRGLMRGLVDPEPG